MRIISEDGVREDLKNRSTSVIRYILSNGVVIDHNKCLNDVCCLQMGIIENKKMQSSFSPVP
jgi:hypothetical protein